jgi:hypothetical protein
VSRRQRRPRSVHSNCVGFVIEPRNRHVAGAETVEIVERNMSIADMARRRSRKPSMETTKERIVIMPATVARHAQSSWFGWWRHRRDNVAPEERRKAGCRRRPVRRATPANARSLRATPCWPQYPCMCARERAASQWRLGPRFDLGFWAEPARLAAGLARISQPGGSRLTRDLLHAAALRESAISGE